MKLLSLFLVAFLACSHVYAADSLTYDGKVVAQVLREVRAPFPIIVDRLLVQIGEDVSTGQKVLEYHLEPGVARHLQYELLSAGDQSNDRMQLAQLEQELLEARSRMRTSAELAARGLGPDAEAKRNNLNYNLIEQRRAGLEQRRRASGAAFELRLKELEGYFGSPLQVGAPLPQQLFLTSPIDATVIDISPQARPHGVLGADTPAMTLAVLNPIQVQIQVYESEISRLQVGMPVTIECVNLNSRKLDGRISMLSLQPIDPAIAVPSFYNVYIDVDNPAHLLKPGYKVLVHVDMADR